MISCCSGHTTPVLVSQSELHFAWSNNTTTALLVSGFAVRYCARRSDTTELYDSPEHAVYRKAIHHHQNFKQIVNTISDNLDGWLDAAAFAQEDAFLRFNPQGGNQINPQQAARQLLQFVLDYRCFSEWEAMVKSQNYDHEWDRMWREAKDALQMQDAARETDPLVGEQPGRRYS